MTRLRNHNNDCNNGADVIVAKYAQKVLQEFDGHVIGCEMGIAWGGNVENTGTMWKGRGQYYGFDTFEGMPKHLGVKKEFETLSWGSTAVDCMDYWYDRLGTNELSYEYQRGVLDELGLDNVVLVKGEMNEHSCDPIPYLNYAFLDMDLLMPMIVGYESIKNKLVTGAYLLLHDVLGNLPLLQNWYQATVLGVDGAMWTVIEEVCPSFIAVLKKTS